MLLLPQVIAVKAGENYNFAIEIRGLAAEIVEVVEELSFIDTNHFQLEPNHELNSQKVKITVVFTMRKKRQHNEIIIKENEVD